MKKQTNKQTNNRTIHSWQVCLFFSRLIFLKICIQVQSGNQFLYLKEIQSNNKKITCLDAFYSDFVLGFWNSLVNFFCLTMSDVFFFFLPLDNALQCSRCAEIVIKMKTVIHVLMRKGSININGADEGGGFNFDANYWKELLFIRLSCQIRKWIMLQMKNFLGCSFLLKVNFMLSVQHLIRGRASLLTQFVKIQLNGH